MDATYSAIGDLFNANKRTFSGRVDWLPMTLPRIKVGKTFNNFMQFFRDHARGAINSIIDPHNGNRHAFNIMLPADRRHPENAEPVFTAFPRVRYVMEKVASYWPIYGLPFLSAVKNTLVSGEAQRPVSAGQGRPDAPSQSLGRHQL